jgi:hypothetical protein
VVLRSLRAVHIQYGLVGDSPIGHVCNLINDAAIADYLEVLRRRLAFSDIIRVVTQMQPHGGGATTLFVTSSQAYPIRVP